MDSIYKSNRNYGIDLLRIFAMFMILLLHILGQGGVIDAVSNDPLKFNLAWLLEVGAFCCVNCYALISGYVGYGRDFKFTNIIMLWLRVIFYTVGITAVFAFIRPETLAAENSGDKFFLISESWDRAIFPVSESMYWYFSAYVFCYFFTPILNKAVQALEGKQLKSTLFMIIALISIPELYTGHAVFGSESGYSGLWLIVLYILGAYMKKYNSLSFLKPSSALMGYIASVSFTWAVKIFIENFIPNFKRANILVSYTSPTIIASAIFLFLFFKSLNPPKTVCKIIGFLSPLAFSVYIIHVHPLIWQNLLKDAFINLGKLPAPLMIPSVIGAAAAVYLVCSLIDLVRHYLFRLLRLKKLVSHIEDKIKKV